MLLEQKVSLSSWTGNIIYSVVQKKSVPNGHSLCDVLVINSWVLISYYTYG